MDIADDAVGVDDSLTVETQYNPQDAVRAGVLGPHVEDQLVGVEGLTNAPRSIKCHLCALPLFDLGVGFVREIPEL